MAQLIRKQSIIDGRSVYYAGGDKWTDNRSEAKTFDVKSDADALVVNTDGKNGAFKNAITETV